MTTLTDLTVTGPVDIYTNGARVGITDGSTSLGYPSGLVEVINEGSTTLTLRTTAYWQGSTAVPYQNNDTILSEVFNTVLSDSLNRSWAGSFPNAYNKIPPGVTDSGTRVGVYGWATSVNHDGYQHDGTLCQQVGVEGRAGFQGPVPSGASAVVIEAVAIRGTIATDSPGSTINNAMAGQFVTRATQSTIKRNTAIYASARGGQENYSFYGDGKLVNEGDAQITGQLVLGKTPIWPGKTPASATAPGTTGEVSWDGQYIYVCVGMNMWRRSALSSW